MTIETVPLTATDRLRSLVAARSIADREGTTLESVPFETASRSGPDADAVAGRVESVLTPGRRPDDEVGDPAEYRRALDTLLRVTRGATGKLDADPAAPLTRLEATVFEAVVRIDGSRPSLLVRDGAVDAEHPTAGDWSTTLAETQDRLRGPIAAIGRVEPANPGAGNFFGTCWVVDAGAGLALTNRHVAEAVWERLPFRVEQTDRGFRVVDGVFVDFVAESGSLRQNRFRVVEAILPDEDGTGFERLDAAVLRLEPLDGAADLPAAVTAGADTDGPMGVLGSFCVVGFPGRPPFPGGVHEGVDWTWVSTTLFGNRYGVKRLAPGTAHRPLGSFPTDSRRWVFGHDLTTLGGNSGSPVLNWLDPAPAAFGLHFAGASVDTNVAHAIAACAEQLRGMGVPVEESRP
jgi:Trypsin-like peptidase domain